MKVFRHVGRRKSDESSLLGSRRSSSQSPDGGGRAGTGGNKQNSNSKRPNPSPKMTVEAGEDEAGRRRAVTDYDKGNAPTDEPLSPGGRNRAKTLEDAHGKTMSEKRANLKKQSQEESGEKEYIYVPVNINKRKGTAPKHPTNKDASTDNQPHSESNAEEAVDGADDQDQQQDGAGDGDGEGSREYSKKSLGILPLDWKLRQWLISLIEWKWFGRAVFSLIIWNSVLLAINDYTVVDGDGNPTGRGAWIGNLTESRHSSVNSFVDSTELFFTIAFTIECATKILAMGLISSKGAYLRDAWNWIDFLVVMASLIDLISSGYKISMLRTFRVLRPLRSLNSMPTLRSLVISLLNSLPALGNVSVILAFVFMVYGILGVQVFQGATYYHCRLSSEPIALPPGEVAQYMRSFLSPRPSDYDQAWADNFLTNRTAYPFCGYPVSGEGFTQATSPWLTPQNCAWPVDSTDLAPCSPDGGGFHNCTIYGTTCGSSYDEFGNPRFNNSFLMDEGQFNGDNNYGYTSYDNFITAFLTTFQCITGEGWTDIMYMYVSSMGMISYWFFCVLTVVGTLFLLNLTLAVIWDNFEQAPDLVEEAASTGVSKEIKKASLSKSQRSLVVIVAEKKGCRSRLADIANDSWFQLLINVCIIANSATLALDKYPTDPVEDYNLEIINFFLTVVFALEFFLKLIGLGPRLYAKDNFNIFDAFIVTASFVEIGMSPPAFIDGSSGGSSLSALRSFRLFRLFKLAKSWTTLQVLLKTIARTVVDISNFLILILLCIFIFALVGMNLFSNKLHFDDYGYLVVFGSEGYEGCHLRPADYTGPCSEVPRNNFDTFTWAVITVFQILTGENWNAVYYDARRGTTGPTATIYFLVLVCVGVFIILNIVLAILLGNFAEEEDEEDHVIIEVKLPVPKRTWKQCFFDVWDDIVHRGHNSADPAASPTEGQKVVPLIYVKRPSIENSNSAEFNNSNETTPQANGQVVVNVTPSEAPPSLIENTVKTTPRPDSPALEGAVTPNLADDALTPTSLVSGGSGASSTVSTPGGRKRSQNKVVIKLSKDELRAQKIEDLKKAKCADCGRELKSCICLTYTSLGCLKGNNKFRKFIASIVNQKHFDNVIIACIVVSSITLALESPLDNPADSIMNQIQTGLGYIFTIMFLIEMVFKIITFGLISHPGSYLRSSWNILDGSLVILSIVTLIMGENAQALRSFKALRTVRCLRPLRVISRNPGMKLIVSTLFAAVPSVGNVMMVVFLFFLIFGIMAINFLKGALYGCRGEAYDGLSRLQQSLIAYPVDYSTLPAYKQAWFTANDTVVAASKSTSPYSELTSRAVCEAMGCEWGPVADQHFDNIANSMSALFQMSTTEGWVDLMYHSIDARGIDMQPVRDSNTPIAGFFCAFIVLGAFLMKNLFVGAVCDAFNKMKDELGGHSLLTPAQKDWIDAQKVIRACKLRPKVKAPRKGIRKVLFDIVSDPLFDNCIMLCILFNTVAMLTNRFGQTEGWDVFDTIFNNVFAVVFTVEAVAKLIAFYPKMYFRDSWNTFDFVVVCSTNAGIVVSALSTYEVGSIATVFRALRVGRVLRLAKRAKGLRHLFDTLIISIPSLANISTILLLIVMIYAVIGVQLFAKVAYKDVLTANANFRTFPAACITLLRALTGENWNGLMYDMARDSPGCVSEPDYDPRYCGFNGIEGTDDCLPLNGCGVDAAYAYMMSYTMLVGFILLNVFIAVLLENFSESDEEIGGLKPIHLEAFTRLWSDRDPDATHFITFDQYSELLVMLPPPLGIPRITEKQHKKLLARVDAPILKNNQTGVDVMEFSEVALALAKYMVKISAEVRGLVLDEIPAVILEKTIDRDYKSNLQTRGKRFVSSGEYTSVQYQSSLVIQRAARKRMLRLKARKDKERYGGDDKKEKLVTESAFEFLENRQFRGVSEYGLDEKFSHKPKFKKEEEEEFAKTLLGVKNKNSIQIDSDGNIRRGSGEITPLSTPKSSRGGGHARTKSGTVAEEKKNRDSPKRSPSLDPSGHSAPAGLETRRFFEHPNPSAAEAEPNGPADVRSNVPFVENVPPKVVVVVEAPPVMVVRSEVGETEVIANTEGTMTAGVADSTEGTVIAKVMTTEDVKPAEPPKTDVTENKSRKKIRKAGESKVPSESKVSSESKEISRVTLVGEKRPVAVGGDRTTVTEDGQISPSPSPSPVGGTTTDTSKAGVDLTAKASASLLIKPRDKDLSITKESLDTREGRKLAPLAPLKPLKGITAADVVTGGGSSPKSASPSPKSAEKKAKKLKDLAERPAPPPGKAPAVERNNSFIAAVVSAASETTAEVSAGNAERGDDNNPAVSTTPPPTGEEPSKVE